MAGACCLSEKENNMHAMHHALPIIALVIALAAFFRARRGSWACSGGPWHHGWHGHGRHHGSRGRGRWHDRGPRAMLYRIFARLDLSPAQEKALRGEWVAVRDKLGALRDEGERTHGDLAAALRGDSFDDRALEAMFSRHDEQLARIRVELTASLRRVHELLDQEQRHQLAELVGGDWRSWRGPYR
jgi:uncharacterized membrane protein